MNFTGNHDRAQGRYLVRLDGIRGIAILLVLFAHGALYSPEIPGRYDRALDLGHVGVTLFFVLSGYLITRQLILEEKERGTVSLRFFFFRRALRLFPALWLYLIVVAGLSYAGVLTGNSWQSFVTSLLYVRNLFGQGHETTHLWSLSLEEQFYLIWPVLFCLLPFRNRARLVCAVAGIALVFAWRMFAEWYFQTPFRVLYLRTDFRFDAPLFGCGLALVEVVYPRLLAVLNRTPVRSATVAMGSVLAWICWTTFEPFPPRWVEFTAFAALCALWVGSQLGECDRVIGRLLSWQPLVRLGIVSYGVYLWHQLFFGPPNQVLGSLRIFPWNLLATFVVAGLSYVLLERPLLRLKHRYDLVFTLTAWPALSARGKLLPQQTAPGPDATDKQIDRGPDAS